MDNPDLLPLGTDSQSANAQRVNPLNAITPPQPNHDTGELHHYATSMKNVSIHREDGTRLTFLFHHFSTSMSADIKFLDREIAAGHPYIRHATPVETQAAMMIKDPRGTIKQEVAAEVEQEVAAKVTANIRARLQAELGISQEAMDKALTIAPIVEQPGNSSEQNIAGTQMSALDKLKLIKTGTATVRPLNTAGVTTNVPPITPVSTSDIKDNSKE